MTKKEMTKRQRSRHQEVADPSPKTIRQRSAAIRDSWNEQQRARRAGIKKRPWTPPCIQHDDLFDMPASGESETAR